MIGTVMISTHTPLAGRDYFYENIGQIDRHFYSHAPRGARLDRAGVWFPARDFYSHAPRGARLQTGMPLSSAIRFLLTRPSRGATCSITVNRLVGKFLLTRPSRGATTGNNDYDGKVFNFYSHAPRGARLFRHTSAGDIVNFYSHAPRGARHI